MNERETVRKNDLVCEPTLEAAAGTASNARLPWGIVAILAVFVPLLALVSGVDYRWTIYLHDHQIDSISDFVAQSLFSGEGFGATDPPVMIGVVVLAAYILSFYRWGARLVKWRPQLGFALVSALLTALVLVHTMKLTVGRARPREVFKYGLHYTPWFRFGSHHLSQGFFSGSFPSGHTVSVAILISIAYLVGGSPQASPRRRQWAWLWGGVVFCYAVFVGLGRCMSGAHWPSDCLAAAGLAWLGVHVLYYYALRIPQQERYLAVYGKPPALPRFWEFKFSGCVVTLGISAMLTIVGARSLVLGGPALWTGVFLLVVPVLAWHFWKLTRRVYADLRSALT
jgi:membrane-associated phospholipid phosphatase